MPVNDILTQIEKGHHLMVDGYTFNIHAIVDEAGMRESVYRRKVDEGRMTLNDALRKIAKMKAIHQVLRSLAEQATERAPRQDDLFGGGK